MNITNTFLPVAIELIQNGGKTGRILFIRRKKASPKVHVRWK